MYQYANKKVKFLVFDGLISIPFLFLMLSPSWFMLGIVLSISFVLLYLSSKGMDLHMLFRKLRTMMIGNRRYNRPPNRKLI
ncbi:IcmT/TraK family protein [Vibrio parahaemolyticus]|uniref:IcmT/TraK family protein n=1 Tax=Vibrio parahaemolyticus TaxID=670 RepID=UPI003D7E34AF